MIFNKIKTVLIIGLLTLFITNAHSQSKTDTTGQKNIYPEKYTFKQAKKYVRQKEYLLLFSPYPPPPYLHPSASLDRYKRADVS